MAHHTDIRPGTERAVYLASCDPSDRTWAPEDGLLVLFGMIAEHLFKEAGGESTTNGWARSTPTVS